MPRPAPLPQRNASPRPASPRPVWRQLLPALLLALLLPTPPAQAGDERLLRVAVLDSSPPMAYRDANGQLTGFTVALSRALCEEMRANCRWQVTTLGSVLDEVASGQVDIAAVSLLETPERRQRVLFAKPYFRSRSLWFAKPNVGPGAAGVRIAVVQGSAQERYAKTQGWSVQPVRTNGELGDPIASGQAQAAIIPMSTALGLMQQAKFRELGLSSTVMEAPELSGDAAFGISPQRPELKEQVDAALERLKRNGTYDRINTQFLPFRIN